MVTVTPLHIHGALLIDSMRQMDCAGYTQQTYREGLHPPSVTTCFPVKQTSLVLIHKNALRGVSISPYAKLLTCVSGQVYSVVIDTRRESPSYLKWAAVVLTADSSRQLFVPAHCGHAAHGLADNNMLLYLQGGTWDPANEFSLSPFFPRVDVHWPMSDDIQPIICQPEVPSLPLDIKEDDIGAQSHRQRVLVIGASGQVGAALVEALEKQRDQYVVIGTCHQHATENLVTFDLEKAARDASQSEMLMTLCRPHIVCICAALTQVDVCENDKQKAEALNLLAVEKLADAAADIGAKIVFYSSDQVFDGKTSKTNGYATDEEDQIVQEPICCEDKYGYDSETMPTAPVNVYGMLKLRAEEYLLQQHHTSLVLRISRVYGPEVQGKNFVYQLFTSLKEGQEVKCVQDEISCPTYNRDIAMATIQLLQRDCKGLYHCAGMRAVSKHQWALDLAEFFQLDSSLIVPVLGPQQGRARRPKCVALATEKLRRELPNFRFHTLEEALKDWKENPHGKELPLP